MEPLSRLWLYRDVREAALEEGSAMPEFGAASRLAARFQKAVEALRKHVG